MLGHLFVPTLWLLNPSGDMGIQKWPIRFAYRTKYLQILNFFLIVPFPWPFWEGTFEALCNELCRIMDLMFCKKAISVFEVEFFLLLDSVQIANQSACLLREYLIFPLAWTIQSVIAWHNTVLSWCPSKTNLSVWRCANFSKASIKALPYNVFCTKVVIKLFKKSS